MKIIYIDSDYKCHIENDGTMDPIETNFFDDKCNEFIEGYRYVPSGKSWTRNDGTIFNGEMVSPWKSYDELDSIQRGYECELAEAARILLGGN